MKANNHMISFEKRKKKSIIFRKKFFQVKLLSSLHDQLTNLHYQQRIQEYSILLPEQINVKIKRQDQLFDINELYLT